MKLEKMEPSKSKKGYYLLSFDDGSSFECSSAEAGDYSLYSGQEFTGDEYDALKSAALLSSAKGHAAALLAYRPMSAGELRKKLIEKGESTFNAEDAVDWLSSLGVLNDFEYAKSIVRHYSAKGWGAGRIREEFRRRFIPREFWDEALGELTGEDERLDSFIARRLAGNADDRKLRKKVADSLYRRGFSWDQIRDALARYSDESYEDDC